MSRQGDVGRLCNEGQTSFSPWVIGESDGRGIESGSVERVAQRCGVSGQWTVGSRQKPDGLNRQVVGGLWLGEEKQKHRKSTAKRTQEVLECMKHPWTQCALPISFRLCHRVDANLVHCIVGFERCRRLTLHWELGPSCGVIRESARTGVYRGELVAFDWDLDPQPLTDGRTD